VHSTLGEIFLIVRDRKTEVFLTARDMRAVRDTQTFGEEAVRDRKTEVFSTVRDMRAVRDTKKVGDTRTEIDLLGVQQLAHGALELRRDLLRLVRNVEFWHAHLLQLNLNLLHVVGILVDVVRRVVLVRGVHHLSVRRNAFHLSCRQYTWISWYGVCKISCMYVISVVCM